MARTSTVKRPNGKNAGEKAVSRSGLRRLPANVAYWHFSDLPGWLSMSVIEDKADLAVEHPDF